MKKNIKLRDAGMIVMIVAFVSMALASDLVDKKQLEQGKVKINKEVVDARVPVDYSKMNK